MKLSLGFKLIVFTPFLIFTIPEIGYCVDSEKTIICPSEIVCSRDKSVSSCKAFGDGLEYWGSISDYMDPVKKGIYTFSDAVAFFQTPYYRGVTSCYYNYNDENSNGNPTRQLLISPKNENIEVLPGISTNWKISGYYAYCSAIDPNLCPLAEVPLIKISMDMKQQEQLDIYANGSPITKSSLSPRKEPYIITMYQAWDSCPYNGLCLLHLIIKEGAGTLEIGSILVDMSDKMKVKFIYPSCGTGYSLSLNSEIQNLIEIKDH